MRGLKGWLAQAEAKQQAAAADVDRFKEVDRRAVECPETPEVVGSVESLAKYLTAPFETDIEKHRVIFKWVAQNISYNAKALQTKNYEVIPGVDPFSPEGVLKARTGVCSAYSRLYKGMTDVVGIETQVIPTPLHVLGRISPIFPPFFPVFCAFSPSRRGGSKSPGPRDSGKGAQTPFHRTS